MIKICEAKITDVEIVIGERLSYPDEKISKVEVTDYNLLKRDFKMNIVILRKI